MPRFLIVYDTRNGERSEILVGTMAQLKDRLEKLSAHQPAGSKPLIWAQVTNAVRAPKSHGSKRRLSDV